MNQVHNDFHEVFYQTLKINNHESYRFDGQWVSLSLDEWLLYVETQSFDINTFNVALNLKRYFLDFVIEKINNANYGAGCHYELYEQRHQAEIEIFLSQLNLTDDESHFFKEKVGYEDDFNPFMIPCDECDEEVSPHASAMSIQLEGRELCYSCLSACYQ